MRKSEYPKDTETLGKKIRKKRMDLKLSLADVAKKADITESYLSRIEAGKKVPSPAIAIKIAEVLNESIQDYFLAAVTEDAMKNISDKYKPSIQELLNAKQFTQILKQKKK